MFRFQRIGIRRWKAVKWTVEYRSPLAGEDMPRKPLDSLEAAHAPGLPRGMFMTSPGDGQRRALY